MCVCVCVWVCLPVFVGMASSLDDGLPSDTEPVAIETAPSKPKPKRKAKAARETGKRKVCTETKGDKSKKKEKKDSRPAMNECCDEHVGQFQTYFVQCTAICDDSHLHEVVADVTEIH